MGNDKFSEDWINFTDGLNAKALGPGGEIDVIPEQYLDESNLGICRRCGREGIDRDFWLERGGYCRACSMLPENLHLWREQEKARYEQLKRKMEE